MESWNIDTKTFLRFTKKKNITKMKIKKIFLKTKKKVKGYIPKVSAKKRNKAIPVTD